MKRKGFTLVELLVVIAIIALLMSILMPALAKVRALAQQVVCGSHLSGIGKAMVIYSNEFRDVYVRAGGANSQWNMTGEVWDAATEALAYPNSRATVGACLYYLIKYADVSPKTFICGGDSGSKEFKLADYTPNNLPKKDIMEAWDFGPWNPASGTLMNILKHYSYAFQYPFSRASTSNIPSYNPINILGDAGIAIMADRSPYFVLTPDATWGTYIFKGGTFGGNNETERWGNSPNHKRDGQNVLFNDDHVDFARTPYCGFNNDNIYTMDTTAGWPQVGSIPVATSGGQVRCFSTSIVPQSKTDSVLINEGKDQGGLQ